MFETRAPKLSPIASRRDVTAHFDDEQSRVPNETTVKPKLRVKMFAISPKKLSPTASRRAVTALSDDEQSSVPNKRQSSRS